MACFYVSRSFKTWLMLALHKLLQKTLPTHIVPAFLSIMTNIYIGYSIFASVSPTFDIPCKS